MAEEKTKKKCGGARKGAGRPGTNSKLYSFRAPGYLAREIDKAAGTAGLNTTDFMKKCLEIGLQGLFEMKENPLEKGTANLERLPFDDDMEKNNVAYSGAEIACGPPTGVSDVETVPESLLDLLGINSENMYLMKARGNSMIDAGIHSGDKLIIDTTCRIPTPEQIAVCELNGEYTLKHFELKRGYGLLIPENKEYDTIKVMPNDDFHIWGVLFMAFKYY